MICLFTAVGCPPVEVVGRLCKSRRETDSCMQKDKQYTKELKNTEYTKWEQKYKTKTNIKGILNNISQ